MGTDVIDMVDKTFASGFAWYVSQLQGDGSFAGGITPADSAAFYNVLYLYYVGGRWRAAERFVSWARENLIDDDNTMWIDPSGIYANRGVYFKGWSILGAHVCGFYDLSLHAIDAVLAYQDETTGGVYCSVSRAHTEQGYTDLNAAALVGFAAFVTGRERQARSAARYIARMVELQPDLPHRFFGYYDPRKRMLLTQLPGALSENLQHLDNIYAEKKTGVETDIDIYHFCLDNEKRDEVGAYAGLSMAFVFLCEMYRVTKEPALKDAAMKMFEFFDFAGDKCWIEGQTTKVLWGLALLSTFTSDARVPSAIERLSTHLCESQVENTGWVSPVIHKSFEEQPYWVSLALSGDILLGLAAVLRYCA